MNLVENESGEPVTFDWQIIVVVICAMLAAGVLLRRAYRVLCGSTGGSCGTGACTGCPSNSDSSSHGLVQLQPPGPSSDINR